MGVELKFNSMDDFDPVRVVEQVPALKKLLDTRDQLREEADLKTSYLRVRALPFNADLAAFVARHRRVYVVEQNRDAQMLQLVRLELASRPELVGHVEKLRSVLHYSGLPIDARFVTEQILAQERASSNPR